MSTHDLYAIPAEHATWDLEMQGASRFTWEYDDGRDRLLSLYQKGKDKQWDSATRIDWSLDVDPGNALGLPNEAIAIFGSDQWRRIENDPKAVAELSQHLNSWQFSQFLHGEQGAMICSARIVESVPDLDSKFYAATQTMDEARHAETYARFLQEKIGMVYPINTHLKALLDDTLSDSRWDMPYLGMQVLIEGLALAAFGVLRDMTEVPLPKQILAYVMQDEARHVAFGRLALKDYYSQLTSAERSEREDFVVEGCYLMRDRLRMDEVWTNLGFDLDECRKAVDASPYFQAYQSLLFTRIVPCVKDIGLWGPKVQKAYADMGVTHMAATDLEALMRSDEDIADRVDVERLALLEAREVAASKLVVDETIALALVD
ncbi:MAG: ferritin-like domain-containing protein [Pseudorhodobacter sp.]|nr:ferritin-like domain-containing protein [Frankiaceae bacterium]